MKAMPFFRVLVIVLFSFQSSNLLANTAPIPLRQALSRKMISLSAVANGGYCGKSLRLEFTNNLSKEVSVAIEPGLIFKPEDSSQQPLILLGDEVIVLASGQKAHKDVQTFCGNASARCPRKVGKYDFWKTGDSNMVKVLRYAHQNSVEISLVQRAMWSITNHFAINSIYTASNRKMSESFIRYVCDLRKRSYPEYYNEYFLDNSPDRPVICSGKERIHVNMHWRTNEGYRHMYVSVYGSNGKIYKRIEGDIVSDINGSVVSVTFDPLHDPRDLYTIKLHDDANKTWQEKKVILGEDPNLAYW